MPYSWHGMFKPWILDRGRDYYARQCVENLVRSETSISAEVVGSETYSVAIDMYHGMPVEMECSCPHAAEGNRCKHMAAVLFAAEVASLLPQEEMDDNDTSDLLPWKTAIEQLPENTLRSIMFDLATDDFSLQRRLIRLHSESFKKAGPTEWKNDLYEMIWDVSDYDDYIPYDEAYGLMMDMIDYMERHLKPLLAHGAVMDAYHLISTVYDVAAEQDMDDSDGGLYSLIKACQDAWQNIFDLASEQEKEQIHQCFWVTKEFGATDFFKDELIEFFLSLDWNSSYQKLHLDWIDHEISKFGHGDYHLRSYLPLREKIMRSLGASDTEVITFWKTHSSLSFARDHLLDLYMQSDPSAAIALLLESKELDKDAPGRLADHSKKLIQLYHQEGMEAEYKNELLFLIFKLKYINTSYLDLLKETCDTVSWASLFSDLLARTVCDSDRFTLLAFDENYPQLIAEIRASDRLYSFTSYQAVLRKWSEEETRDCFVHLLKKEMERASNRKNYWSVIQHLHQLDTYPNGRIASKELANYWRIYHNNRPAMKDELRKAGY